MKDPFPKVAGFTALAVGIVAAAFYAYHGLTLSHYDAKAHLVVARRVLDSLTPEYSQIGAVWLPLPHLLNLLPVQIDWFYRTGASAVAMSVVAFAVGTYAAARLVMQATGSRLGAAIAAALFALDPDVLYLQSTPMTEPLLFALTLLAVSLTYEWLEQDASTEPKAAGWTLALACLTRYEAWCVMAVLVVLTLAALKRKGLAWSDALYATSQLAVYPALAIGVFILHSRYTIGEWFVTGGFFVVDPRTLHRPLGSLLQVTYGIRQLLSDPLVAVAVVGIATLAARIVTNRKNSSSLVLFALTGFLLLPMYAFFEGHPFRMRYMIAPVVATIIFVGVAVGAAAPRWRTAAAAVVLLMMAASVRPLNAKAPMVQEAQWDHEHSLGRQHVTDCLMRDYHHEPILASMGSLAHYMQELSNRGLYIRDFVHEGNLPYWQEAIEAPNGRVGWILIEEQAEGGDLLAQRARASSEFLLGFKRVCDGGGVALYKSAPETIVRRTP